MNNSISKQTLKTGFWIFFTFTALYLSVNRGHFIGSDEIAAYQMTRSLWERGDLSTGWIHNTFEGRDGLYYSQYAVGQSIAALPLYGLGKATRHILESRGNRKWIQIFAGSSLGEEPVRWGGDVEIFFVNLFGCFATAFLVSVFFLMCVAFGASVRSSLTTAALLGTCTYVAPFSGCFLRHTVEALFLLMTIGFLVLDARGPSSRARFLAGLMMGMGIHFRLAFGATWPALFLFVLFTVWRRRPEGKISFRGALDLLKALVPFVVPMVVGLALHMGVSYWKFESLAGEYNAPGFHLSLLPKCLYVFLFSSGYSVFLYTPLLILVPWLMGRHLEAHRAEATLLIGLAATYLCFYGTYEDWHGLWSALGPRYLMPMTPFLLLPLAHWLDHCDRKGWALVVCLGALGLAVQIAHVSTSFAYVYHYEGYPQFQPEHGFLFIPEHSPLLAHFRALWACDHRVDMWLVTVYRTFGMSGLAPIGISLLGCLTLGVVKTAQSMKR